jgi:hypothetical protein
MAVRYIKETYREFVNKFGSNQDVDTARETVWEQGGLYNYLGAASVLNITSSSTNDDVGGTGALTIEIQGLDTNYDRISETVILTGQTIKATSNEYLRIFRAIVLTTGSGNENAGTIYAFTGTETNGVPDDSTKIYTTIAPTKNQTLQAFYTIPAGFTGTMTVYNVSTSTIQNVTMELVAREVGTTPFLVKSSHVVNDSTVNIHVLGIEFPQKTDIEVRAQGSLNNNIVSATFCVTLEERV